MKALHRISLVLIAIPLLAILWSSIWMMGFVQFERLEMADHPQMLFKFENFVHEAGFARLTLAVIGLLILFVPYRRGEAWAFAALVVLTVCYVLPVFFLDAPNLGLWHIFRVRPNFGTTSLAPMNFYRYVLTILALAGLGLALPQFLATRGNIRT